MKTLLAVLAGGTCFCCNSKLRAGEVWRGNSSVGLVSMAHVYFHWKQQIFKFRSIIYSSDKHYGFRLALLDDANIFLLGGISLFSLSLFFFYPWMKFWNKVSIQFAGTWLDPPSFFFFGGGNRFHSLQLETFGAHSSPSAVTQPVGWRAAYSHADVSYIRSTFRRSNPSRPNPQSIY